MNTVSIALHCDPVSDITSITTVQQFNVQRMYNYLTANNLNYNCLGGQNSTAD